MKFTCVIGAFGGDPWPQLMKRAEASTAGQGFTEVVTLWKADGTVAQVRNEAADLATDDDTMLVFLDADDELAPGYINAMQEMIAGLKAGQQRTRMLYPAVSYVYGRQARAAKMWPEMPIQDGNWMVIGTAVHRSLFDAAGGFREWPMYEDWDLWQRIVQQGGRPTPVAAAVYVAHAQPLSRNRKPNRRAREAAHHAIRSANYPHLYTSP